MKAVESCASKVRKITKVCFYSVLRISDLDEN